VSPPLASILTFVEQHDQWALLVMFALLTLESFGLPLPGETALIACAVLASQGKLSIAWVIAVGVLAAIVGDNLGYWAARRGGRPLLERNRFTREYAQKYLPRGERFFARHGGKAVFLARFVAVLRVTAAWIAGLSPPAGSSGRPSSRCSPTSSATQRSPRSAATACTRPAASC